MILDRKENSESIEKQTNKELFEKQKHTLDLFLERKAISQDDYDKSISVLKAKMKLYDFKLIDKYKIKKIF